MDHQTSSVGAGEDRLGSGCQLSLVNARGGGSSPTLGAAGPGSGRSAGWPGCPSCCSHGSPPGSPVLCFPPPQLHLCALTGLHATSAMTTEPEEKELSPGQS